MRYDKESLLEIFKNTAIEKLGLSEEDASEFLSAAIERCKAESIDIGKIISKDKELLSALGQISNRELDKFISYAKEQGAKMPFESMEMGILAAGRKDMQNGLVEILNSMKFDKPSCPECGEILDNRGHSKKKF